MGMIPIRCTACGEAAQIDETWLGQLVECPHCHQPTPAALAPLPPSGPPVPPPAMERVPRQEAADAVIEPKQPEPKPAEPPPKRASLTRAERLAIRRRRQLIVAFSGGVILVIALFALLALRS
jgi:hypothetical protein